MTTAVVLVPWRPGQPQRERAWKFLSESYWPLLGSRAQVFTADSPADRPFSKAVAVNRAAQDAGNWEVAIIADADTFVPVANLRRAMQEVERRKRTVIPYDRWSAVTPQATMELVGGASFDDRQIFPHNLSRTFTRSPGSVIVLHRYIWDSVGGMDETSVGQGWETRNFVRALELAPGGVTRLRGEAWQLWRRREPLDRNIEREGRRHYAPHRQATGLSELRQLRELRRQPDGVAE